MYSSNLYIFLSLLCLNNVFCGDVEYKNADELDRKLIQQTGCKYLYLSANQTAWFTKGELQHTTMATFLPEQQMRAQYRDPLENSFEAHFAIRADAQVELHMFSGFRYVADKEQPDYKFGFGYFDNKKCFVGFQLANYPDSVNQMSRFLDTPTPGILAADTYANLYVKIDDKLTYGKHCEVKPFASEKDFTIAPLEVVKFGFLAKGEHGAKILYDCPSDFANCPCDWVVRR